MLDVDTQKLTELAQDSNEQAELLVAFATLI